MSCSYSSDAEPQWLRAAVADAAISDFFYSRGTRLHVLKWNWHRTDLPAVLLVHGYLAHAHWWDLIAPMLAREHRVAALDLAGMGDSGTRSAYPPDGPALDILDAIDHLNLAPATVVGHSYGGSRTLLASTLRSDRIRRAIVLDSYFNFPGEVPPQGPALGPLRFYASVEEALARYRFRPADVAVPDYVRQYVGRLGLRQEPAGWRWKFEPGLSVRDDLDGAAILRATRLRVDYVRGGASALIDAARANRIMSEFPAQALTRLHVVPDGHHHFLLQDPPATARLLADILRD